MKWTKQSSKRAHEAKARLRMQSEREEPELTRLPAGEMIGTLTWHAVDGTVRKWIVRQGLRANNLTVEPRVHGVDYRRRGCTWTRLFAWLRVALSVPLRRLL